MRPGISSPQRRRVTWRRCSAARAAQWETRFADLLADHPDAEGELAALVKGIRPAVTASDHSVAAGGNVTATAQGRERGRERDPR